MENNTEKKQRLIKLMFPVILIVLFVAGYFIYKGFFSSTTDKASSFANAYLSGTKLGKNVDIINKENLSFSTNINNSSLRQNFSSFEIVHPSQEIGRANPFLP